MKRSEYVELKNKIIRQYREDLRALERVWAMAGEGQVDGSTRDDSSKMNAAQDTLFHASPSGGESLGYGGLINRVRNTVKKMQGLSFTAKDVTKAIVESEPSLAGILKEVSVSQALKRLRRDGELGIKEKGGPYKATKFKRI
jgi:hypothetical protein